MPFRFPTSIPKTLTEMWERLREFVRQLEPVILKNVAIGTTETAVAHGLGERPAWFGWDPPHCIAIVRQTRDPDQKCVYLRATNPCVIDLKFVRGGPFKASNGRHDLADWDPAGSALGDHKFSTDATDEAANGAGYALAKLSSTGNVKPTLDTSGGQRRTQFNVTLPTVPSASDYDPKPLGVADPGVGVLWSRWDHVHPASDPVADGAYLFPCYIPDPYLHTPCRGLLPHGGPLGFGLVWELIDGISTWRKTGAPGQLYISPAVGGTLIPSVDGDILLAWAPVPYSDENKFYWLYEVVDCGYHLVQAPGAPEGTMMGVSTDPVIRRAMTANTSATVRNGATVQVVGAGVEFEGEYFTIDTADPIVVDTTPLSISHSSSYTSRATQRALTPAQVVSEGASADEYPANTGVTSATPAGIAMFYTPTLPGTPGAASIPAGPWTVTAKDAAATGGDAGATSVLKACFGVVPAAWVFDDGLPTPFLTAISPPLSSTPTTVTFQAVLAAPVTISPTDRFVWWWEAATTSATAVTVSFTWQDAGRVTRVATTMQFPTSSGTNWHPDMLGRNSPDQHPYSALEPVGLARVPLLAATLTAGGALALGASNRYLVDPAGLDLAQIATPTVPANATVELELVFADAVKLQHATTPDAGFSSLYLHRAGSIKNPVWFKYANSVARFLYVPSLSAWKLMSMHDTT